MSQELKYTLLNIIHSRNNDISHTSLLDKVVQRRLRGLDIRPSHLRRAISGQHSPQTANRCSPAWPLHYRTWSVYGLPT